MSALDRDLYETMVRCRAFEDELIAGAARDGIRVGHPYRGQEAVAAGVCLALRPDDRMTSTHRSHGHAVAKGCDPTRLALELYGRVEGFCCGRGGEMNVADYSVGFMGATEIVGGNLAMASGLALAARLERSDRVTVAFLGEGGANQGSFAEVLNLASVWLLPLVIVCENNGYAESTPAEYALGGPGLVARAGAYGLPGMSVYGQDVFAVHDAASGAVARARAGFGASLIEARTYRYYGHYYGDRDRRYRTALELARWKARDPIALARAALTEAGTLEDGEADEIAARASEWAGAAFVAAREGSAPGEADLLDGVFVGQGVSG